MTDYKLNRMANSKNGFQGDAKKVLCVCSAGLLRSPTAAEALQRKYGYNTRAAGSVEEYALIYADPVLVYWADEVVFMEKEHKDTVEKALGKQKLPKFQVLNIPDRFMRNGGELIDMVLQNYKTNDRPIERVKR